MSTLISNLPFHPLFVGTDDDLPPSHQNRGARVGRLAGNGRAVMSALPYPRLQNDMETQIHQLEQEAYTSVLRAFKAQSDAITWVLRITIYFVWLFQSARLFVKFLTCTLFMLSFQEKESLITELRKELRVSDEEHRELLSIVNADDIIRRIRSVKEHIFYLFILLYDLFEVIISCLFFM